MDRHRWTDERLDDAVRTIERRLDELEDLGPRVSAIEAEVKLISDGTLRCLAGIEQVNRRLEDREKSREQERRDRDKERKTDRRWLVGTGLTSAGLIVAAVGLLADKI